MIRFRPLPAMSVLSLIALVILIALGNWQFGKFEMKRHARATPPAVMTIGEATPQLGKIQLVYVLTDAGPAWRVFVPATHDGETTFLDTGAIAGIKPPDWRTVAEPFLSTPLGLKGMPITPPKPPWTASLVEPKPNVPGHVWYRVDLPAMAKAAGLGKPTDYYLALPYKGPDGALIPNPYAHAVDPLPPERHFGYALTWWGLAAALVAVYAAFHIRAGRLSFGRKA